MLSRKKTAKSVCAYQNNAIKKDPTGGHTTIKALLYEEIKKIPECESEEKSARKTIKEYLYQYILERDIDDSDLEDTTNTAGMTIEEQDEELENYVKKVPLSFTFPGMVDGKAYIIVTVNLSRRTMVHNLPAEFKNFPVLIDYGTMRASTASDEYHKYQNLKPGISALGDSGALVFDQDSLL
ncbi:6187_t:CDS:2 [Funneliformis mosseae]|uniref:6187_t:CDS:1 n=1 Tax=Funneliformis mosseae TaxID=27381 RepID=A0A9N8YLP6_FUNMO|nr:6187_t:CDS:2 [Funneliformis mosseae]